MCTPKHRMAQLGQAHHPELRRTRCAQPRDWPATRTVEIDTEGHETWKNPEVPGGCPRCGRLPFLVGVLEVEDWQWVSRPHRERNATGAAEHEGLMATDEVPRVRATQGTR